CMSKRPEPNSGFAVACRGEPADRSGKWEPPGAGQGAPLCLCLEPHGQDASFACSERFALLCCCDLSVLNAPLDPCNVVGELDKAFGVRMAGYHPIERLASQRSIHVPSDGGCCSVSRAFIFSAHIDSKMCTIQIITCKRTQLHARIQV